MASSWRSGVYDEEPARERLKELLGDIAAEVPTRVVGEARHGVEAVERGEELAQRLESGTAWVNQHLALAPTIPFGGVKWSGIGRENGPWGVDEFCELQVVNTARG